MTRQQSRLICAKAASLCDIRRFDEALRILPEAAAADPTDPQPYCLMAHAHNESARYAAAEESARRALVLDPAHQWATRLLAESFLKRNGRAKQAVEAANRAVALGPRDPRNFIAAAKAYDAYGMNRHASAYAEQALKLAPGNVAALETVALVEFRAQRFRSARKYFRAQLKIAPNSWSAHNNLGAVAQGRGRAVAAVRHFMRSIRIEPNQLPITNLRRSISYAGGFLLNVYVVLCAASAAAIPRHRPQVAPVVAAVYTGLLLAALGWVWWRSTPAFRRALLDAVPAVLSVVGIAAAQVGHQKGRPSSPRRERYGATVGVATAALGPLALLVPGGAAVPLAILAMYLCGMLVALYAVQWVRGLFR
jgi:tetratricopeptide (TPR) repeat protein